MYLSQQSLESYSLRAFAALCNQLNNRWNFQRQWNGAQTHVSHVTRCHLVTDWKNINCKSLKQCQLIRPCPLSASTPIYTAGPQVSPFNTALCVHRSCAYTPVLAMPLLLMLLYFPLGFLCLDQLSLSMWLLLSCILWLHWCCFKHLVLQASLCYTL